ncbi:hypothetical protein ACP4OV_010759 [Aristida adscensionis]
MRQSAAAVAVVLALLAAAAAVAMVGAEPSPPPEYTTQEDVTSDFVKQVCKFAVTMFGLGHRVSIYYVSTSQCWSKPAGDGANYYWAVLTARNSSGATGKYVTTMWGIPGSESRTWKLYTFDSTY